jgi:hypothetical protein
MVRCGGKIGAYTAQQNFVDRKCLEHCHVQDIAGKCYGMQLVTIRLGQQHARLHNPNM